MFVFPEGLPLELTPFAFVIGKWEGTGVISFKDNDSDEAPTDHEFKQRVEFAHDGSNAITYISSAELIGEPGTALPSEIGYWRIARNAEPADHGPGLLPGVGEPSLKSQPNFTTAKSRVLESTLPRPRVPLLTPPRHIVTQLAYTVWLRTLCFGFGRSLFLAAT